jgi:hypothetical protein
MAQGMAHDLTGNLFGRLTVIERVKTKQHGHRVWLCECSCGNTKEIRGGSLVRGDTESCGCLKKEVSRDNLRTYMDKFGHVANKTHGLSGTDTYNIYHGMLSRCYNANSSVYEYYGAKGVIVCERWKESVVNFIEDMGERPSKEYSLERLNGNLGYCKDNVIWATDVIQARNNSMRVNNISGVTGVCFSKYNDCWVAFASNPNTMKAERGTFPLKKYGEDAFKMACEWRDKTIERYNRDYSAGYSEGHGCSGA